MRFTKSHSYFSFFFHQQAFLHPLVSATYIPVLKRPVCGFGCKVSVPVLSLHVISIIVRGQTNNNKCLIVNYFGAL